MNEKPIYQISLATGRATSSAWIDVTKDQYDDAGMYPEYARRIVHFHPATWKPFVRLSDEKVMTMAWDEHTLALIQMVQDALEKKNRR